MTYKFRGVSKKSGEVIFGSGLLITDNWEYDILHTGDKKSARIFKGSGAQLRGFDINGAEIYEGDIVQDGADDSLIADSTFGKLFDSVYNQLLDTELCTLLEANLYDTY